MNNRRADEHILADRFFCGQIDLFGLDVQEDGTQPGGLADDGLPDIPEWPVQQLLAYEKEVLGLYLSGHPLAEYEEVGAGTSRIMLRISHMRKMRKRALPSTR